MSAVDWFVLVLLWGAALVRFPAAMRDYTQRMLWAAFAGLAVSRVFSARPVVDWLIAVTGVEWATLFRHVSGLLSATFLLAFVEKITRNGWNSRTRWIWPAATVVMGFLLVLFVVQGGHIYWVPGHPGETATAGRIYLLGFDLWLIYCLGMAAAMFIAYVHKARGRKLMQAGLIISAVGMIAGVLNRGEVLVVNLFTLLRPQLGVSESDPFGRFTLALTVVGITLGTSLPALNAGIERWRQAAALRELRPLWEALRTQYPSITLDFDGPLKLRLFRRVVEIRDGMLTLTSVAEPPAGETPDEVAAWLSASLEAAQSGDGTGVPSGSIPGPDFAGDIDRETAWLRQVAAAYKRLGGKSTVSRVS